MILIFYFIVLYTLSFCILTLFREIKSEKIINDIKNTLDKDEQIIYTGWFHTAGIVILCVLFGISGLAIFYKETIVLFLCTFCLSIILITSTFNYIIVLTNKKIFYTYGYGPQTEQIKLQDIKESKYDRFLGAALRFTLYDNKNKAVSNLTNLKEINSYIISFKSEKQISMSVEL